MGVTVGDIVSYIENWAPLSYAEDYDRPGLELGHTDAPVRIIVLSVDASQKAVDFAVSHRADLLLVHHPLFFHPLSNGSDRDLTGRRVLKLAENHIALYAAHTNLDSCPGGNNDHACSLLGLEKVEAVAGEGEKACLRIGRLPQARGLCFRDFARLTRVRFGLSFLKMFGDPDKMIRTIALCTGSGMEFAPLAVSKGADVLVTGDITYHRAEEALAEGLCLIDAGHYETDALSLEWVKGHLEDFVQSRQESVAIITAPLEAPGQMITKD